MKPQPPARSGAIYCGVAATGKLRAAEERIAALRQSPGSLPGVRLPANLLKHSDEQTVAGVAAVFAAINDSGIASAEFRDWGVVAAPRFLGRAILAVTFERFAIEGAWGVSPHLIPHRSLHAVAGTISQALKIQGPNFGVSGGPNGISEALLAGAALLQDEALPGVWVIVSGWDPEPVTQRENSPARVSGLPITPICAAVALALTPLRNVDAGLKLRLEPGFTYQSEDDFADALDLSAFRLASLLETLEATDAPPTTVLWGINGGVRIEFQRTTAVRRLPAGSSAHSLTNGRASFELSGVGAEK